MYLIYFATSFVQFATWLKAQSQCTSGPSTIPNINNRNVGESPRVRIGDTEIWIGIGVFKVRATDHKMI